MGTKSCPACKTDIDFSAKKCPQCRSDLRIWIFRHPIIASFLGLLILLILVGILPGENLDVTDNAISNDSENLTTLDELPKKSDKELCESLSIGDKKDRVIEILGEPDSKTESEFAGLGRSEYLIYQKLALRSCQITIFDNEVQSRSWIEL